MIELLQNLITIPSFSREEAAVADFLQNRMREAGIDVKRKGNNLWAESEPRCGKPTVLLNAHTDTVKPASDYTRNPFLPTREGDRIYGLGSNDDGGSLVAMLETFQRLYRKELPFRLVFSATAEEEISGAGGLDAVLEDFGEISLGIIGEPTGMKMAVAEKGLLVLDCTAVGRSGHAARGEGVNAIYKAMEDMEWFRTYRFPKVSEFLGEVRMNVTIVNAGSLHNVVPEKCTFTVDIRPNGEYSNMEILETVRSHVGSEVKPRSMTHNSSGISMEHPVVRCGLALGLEAFGSPTLSNQTRCDFPTIKIGPGDSARSHTADEYVCESEIRSAADVYEKLLLSYGNTLE
ncbi:MAG: M20 family metallo-hydrolase [Bacteroidales bacterium]|nr:M20 family metallo-hydrolase [Bacteroidales bacterium]